MEIHLVTHRNRKTPAIRIFAFSTEALAKEFIVKQHANFKRRHLWVDTWAWKYRKVELDKEV